AVWLPGHALDELERLPRLPLAGARWTTRPQWHVTLRFFGSADPAVAQVALDGLVAEPCVAVLGPRPHRLGRAGVVVPGAGLDALAAAVVQATAHVGEPPEDRPFRGHVTLARSRLGKAPRLDAEVSASWPVGEVALVVSHPHPAGSRYETVHTVPLTAR